VSYRLEALAPHHRLDEFGCSNLSLETWLAQHARNAVGQGTRA
jgi:hypothetical protein